VFSPPILLDEITFIIETAEGSQAVTVPFEFSDFASFEIERVGVLTKGVDDPKEVACAFLFVAAARQIDLEDDDFAPFRESIALMFDGDDSMIRWTDG
jgi:hypothetical protein